MCELVAVETAPDSTHNVVMNMYDAGDDLRNVENNSERPQETELNAERDQRTGSDRVQENSDHAQGEPEKPDHTVGAPKVIKTDAQWRELLTPFEYHVLREAGTERAGTGELLGENRPGMYHCRACGAELFRSETKFESFCGWPSFFDPNEKDAVVYVKDDSLGMERVEVRCAKCHSHLGHVFPDAPQTPTGLRYCMNSVSLTFEPEKSVESKYNT